MKLASLFILFLVLLCSCGSSTAPDATLPKAPGRWEDPPDKESAAKPFPKNVYLIDQGGCVFRDSLLVDSLGNNLFRDKKGNLYLKTFEAPREGNNPVLISRLFNACEGDSTLDLKRMIDASSFKDLGFGFYKDKDHVFYLNEMADGGNVVIVDGADARSFVRFTGSEYGKDNRHVFYRTEKLNNADPASFQPIYFKEEGQQDSISYSGKDKSRYYHAAEVCNKEEAYHYKRALMFVMLKFK